MNEPSAERDLRSESDRIGPIATPARVIAGCLPIAGIIVTPLLPFAKEPTLWLGLPAVMVWMAVMVVLTVVVLQVVDRSIRRQAARAPLPEGPADTEATS